MWPMIYIDGKPIGQRHIDKNGRPCRFVNEPGWQLSARRGTFVVGCLHLWSRAH